MKTLMFVEPVVFRGDPLFLAPHITGWALPMLQAHRRERSDPWALASSQHLCDLGPPEKARRVVSRSTAHPR
jgi:hypothetical protein